MNDDVALSLIRKLGRHVTYTVSHRLLMGGTRSGTTELTMAEHAMLMDCLGEKA